MISKVDIAFDRLRTLIGAKTPVPSTLVRHGDEMQQLTLAQGLTFWRDGSVINSSKNPICSPPDPSGFRVYLWAVQECDVPVADEECPHAAQNFHGGKIKHSNLTGGAAAFAGGEMLIVNSEMVVINGKSGRFGPKTQAHMEAAATAFKESGYHVWTMGWDKEANRPYSFTGVMPQWVSE